MVVFSFVLVSALAYVVGSMPLGLWFARFRGLELRRSSAYNIGLDNSLRVVGAGNAVVLFVLDFCKGLLAVFAAGLLQGSEAGLWATLAAFVGHLYPPAFWGAEVGVLRGRGHTMLLGVLCGLVVFVGLPVWVALVPLLVGAGVALWSGFIASGMVVGATVFTLVALVLPTNPNGRVAVLLFFALLMWRLKENIGRLLERTEPRLGQVQHVAGEREDRVVAAFIIHALTPDDVWKSGRMSLLRPFVDLGWLPFELVSRWARFVRPFKIGELRGMYTRDGKEIHCHLLSAPFTPQMFKDYPDLAVERATQGARLAYALGASTYGLGAFWGTVGKKGEVVQEAVPEIAVTNGGAYTSGTIKAQVPLILERFKREGRDVGQATAAVVGANGVVAFGMARMIAPHVGRVILIGRDLDRLERSKATLLRAHPKTAFECSLDAHDCTQADLVFAATSDPDPVIFARDVKPNTWIFDEGRPNDADQSVLTVPGVRIVPGGVVRPPGGMTGSRGWATGTLGFGYGAVPACLAETLIIAANRAFERKSLGDVTKTENIVYFVEEAQRLGFEVLEDMPETPPETGHGAGEMGGEGTNVSTPF